MKNIIRLNDKELQLLKDVQKITNIDYDIDGNTIEPINLLNALSDLKFEYNLKTEE